MRTEKVAVVGQGYVGLPLAIRTAEVGYSVVGYDLDDDRVSSLRAGRSYVEDIEDETLARALGSGRYHPTGDTAGLAGFDVAVISVPTPLRDGAPDLSFIERAGKELSHYLRPGVLVVLESTTYPGTTQEFLGPILEDGSSLKAGVDFHLGYSPERIDPGNTSFGLVNTPKVVSGVDEASLAAVRRFYDSIVEQTVPVSTPREAELCKLLENTFRHVNIALVNELAMFASDLGADIWEVLDAADTKPFGYLRFNPGPGVGGHCLPIDPSYLSWRVKRHVGLSFRFVELANDVNEHMPDYVVRRLVAALNRRRQVVNGARIVLLGFAYKRNTSDARESPSVAVADRLLAMGAEVVAVDPHVDPDFLRAHATVVASEASALDAADAVVLLVDHDLFDSDAIAGSAPYVLDTRGCMSGPTVERL